MAVKVTIRPQWKKETLAGIQAGLLDVTTAIHERSAILAPKDTRALVKSGKVEKTGSMEYTVSYGSPKVPYAHHRHYENKKNPQTVGYLAKAAESVARGETAKYFKDKIK